MKVIGTTREEACKRNAIRLAQQHRKTCEGAACNISLYHLLLLLQMAGIELTDEERKEFS